MLLCKGGNSSKNKLTLTPTVVPVMLVNNWTVRQVARIKYSENVKRVFILGIGVCKVIFLILVM